MAKQVRGSKSADFLEYRYTPALAAGDAVHVREIPQDAFRGLWSEFQQGYRKLTGATDAQPPYTAVQLALIGITGGYVHFDPSGSDTALLVTSESVSGADICDAFTMLYQSAMRQELDLSQPPDLARLVASTKSDTRYLAGYLEKTRAGQPVAPEWVFATASWGVMRRLSATPFMIDGHEIALRPCTDGKLISWATPWERNGRHAMARIGVSVQTRRGITDPVIVLSGSVTRLDQRLSFAKTVVTEQSDRAKPLVSVRLDRRGRISHVNKLMLGTMDMLAMGNAQALNVKEIQHRIDEELAAYRDPQSRPTPWTTAAPDHIRPVMATNRSFPIGTGPGMHFHRELNRHFQNVYGETAAPPRNTDTRLGLPKSQHVDGYIPAEERPACLTSAGGDRLRVVCLYQKQEQRNRMIREIHRFVGLDPDRAAIPDDGTLVDYQDGALQVVIHYAPEALAHGPETGRRQLLRQIPELKPEPGTLTVAFCETQYGKGTPLPKETEDAKHQVRRLLAADGIPTQFLKPDDKDKSRRKPPKPPKIEDYPAYASLLDIGRIFGLADSRITKLFADTPVARRGDEQITADEIAYVGIHARRQARRNGSKRMLTVNMTALMPPDKNHPRWWLTGWSMSAPRWLPIAQAITAFHAQDMTTGALDAEMKKTVAQAVDQALAQLSMKTGKKHYVVFAEAEMRRFYDGLADKNCGSTPEDMARAWLPGLSLPQEQQPLAVVRLRTGDEVSRPVGTTTKYSDGRPPNTKMTTNGLYRVDTDFGDPYWLLAKVPRQYDGNGAGRLGGSESRWSTDAKRMRENWYSMNTTEICPLVQTGVDAEILACLTAKMCDQGLAWDGSTVRPIPLHNARLMDSKHPMYRHTIDMDAQEGDEVAID